MYKLIFYKQKICLFVGAPKSWKENERKRERQGGGKERDIEINRERKKIVLNCEHARDNEIIQL